jgi:hypothetical protein
MTSTTSPNKIPISLHVLNVLNIDCLYPKIGKRYVVHEVVMIRNVAKTDVHLPLAMCVAKLKHFIFDRTISPHPSFLVVLIDNPNEERQQLDKLQGRTIINFISSALSLLGLPHGQSYVNK